MTSPCLFPEVIHRHDHLVVWNTHEPKLKADVTCQAFWTSGGWWLLDPIMAPADLGESLGGDPVFQGILLTSENHERKAGEWAREMGLKIYASKRAGPHLEISGAHFFGDREELPGGVIACHVPGASHGETFFHIPALKLLILGDALINLPGTGLAYLPEKYCLDSNLSKKSLGVLLNLDFNIACFAHGGPILKDARQAIQKLFTGGTSHE